MVAMEGKQSLLSCNIWIVISTIISLTIQITAAQRSRGRSDGWGPWQPSGQCSRTCGGGVQQSSRQCQTGRPGGVSCQGSSTTYQSCNTQPCPEGSKDFRQYQCSAYNAVPTSIKGRREQTYKWTPVYEPRSLCKLMCQNEYGDIQKLRDSTIDGTTCDSPRAFGVCVNGFCKPTGCDHVIGSVLAEDKCLVCDGSGDNCHTVSGDTMGRRLNHDGRTQVIEFPKGATTIRILLKAMVAATLELDSPTTGRSVQLTNTIFTFGQRKVLEMADTSFTFNKHRDQDTTSFSARGPINETLQLYVRFDGLSPLVEYEYSTKIKRDDEDVDKGDEDDPTPTPTPQRYQWKKGTWTECSTTCDVGYQQRAVNCIDYEERKYIKDEFCPLSEMPAKNKTCNHGACKSSRTLFQWTEGRWDDCNVNCGLGEQTRQMMCVETGASGSRASASEDLCRRYAGQRPVVKRACRGQSEECPKWMTSEWSECSVTCDRGVQSRSVTCQLGSVALSQDRCPTEERPDEELPCVKPRCPDDGNNRVQPTTTTTTTTTRGPPRDCRRTRYGCCPDNVTPARGSNFQGCKTTTSTGQEMESGTSSSNPHVELTVSIPVQTEPLDLSLASRLPNLEEIISLPSEGPTSIKCSNCGHNNEISSPKINKICKDRFVKHVQSSDKTCFYYTGVPTLLLLNFVFSWLSPYVDNIKLWDGSKNSKGFKIRKRERKCLSHFDEFILTLIRLRRGSSCVELSYMFNISINYVSRISIAWIIFLDECFSDLITWPSRELTLQNMPECFSSYPKTRVIIDCTEYFTQKPLRPHAQKATYSSYKHTNTFKQLIGIMPSGMIIFVSKLYAGNISDQAIVKNCGILNRIEPGDDIMADRGFNIQHLLLEKGATLNIPAFTHGKNMSLTAVKRSRRIASVRIHVERAIGRMKTFKILNGTVPLRLRFYLNSITKIIAVLCNLQERLAK